MSELIDVKKLDLIECVLLWDRYYNIPVYLTQDDRHYVPMTGEFAGYYEEIKSAPKPKTGDIK